MTTKQKHFIVACGLLIAAGALQRIARVEAGVLRLTPFEWAALAITAGAVGSRLVGSR